VTVTLDGVANDGSPGENDSVAADIESANGGSGNDTLVGNAGPNVLVGGKGVDTVRGLGGDDTIDTLDHVAGDIANGGAGVDYCVSDPGDSQVSCETGPMP
jgi:Ca2+-binding RTX toxin-like protein